MTIRTGHDSAARCPRAHWAVYSFASMPDTMPPSNPGCVCQSRCQRFVMTEPVDRSLVSGLVHATKGVAMTVVASRVAGVESRLGRGLLAPARIGVAHMWIQNVA
jgi:hypothetical protein